RPLAERRQFPAIDITRSVSRLADELLDEDQLDLLRQAHEAIATFDDARPMIESGLYRQGASEGIDRAIALQPALAKFLRQPTAISRPLNETTRDLATLLAGGVHG